jgi:hypothetical protein
VARETLQTLLVDRVDCTPVLVAGTRGYAFTGDEHVRRAAGGQHVAHYLMVAPMGFDTFCTLEFREVIRAA